MKLDQYLGTVPPHRKHIFRELLCFINMMYPDAKPSMKYKMPTFTNGNGWVALANQKTLYLALHLQPSAPR